MSFAFQMVAQEKSSQARLGIIHTDHGVVETPAFMPVATQGTVKGLTPEEVAGAGYHLLCVNTYHLYLRPGYKLILEKGGLGKFMGWSGALLSDSGGFQAYSLAKIRKIDREGVTFQSHIDGSAHLLTPELSMLVQGALATDIAMVLDECMPYPASEKEVLNSLELSRHWAERSKASARPGQAVFGIVQGGVYPSLRRKSLDETMALDFDGYALGGLAVGEPDKQREEIVAEFAPQLPAERPRYLMGVGYPQDILSAVACGIDLFDCVLPTRCGRNALLFTTQGPINIRNACFREDDQPADPSCSCPVCRKFSRAYLRHLFLAREMLAPRLASLHNLYFYADFFNAIRKAIGEGILGEFSKLFLERYRSSGEETAVEVDQRM
jgi:queuine tRNA-ribosyltransferase